MQFDHVEMFVTDRAVACQWYGSVLGFHPVEEFADWAEDGPLMIANDQQQMIALFVGAPQADHPVRGLRRLALRASADEFARFVKDSSAWSDPPLGRSSIADHQRSISAYFTDPFGNPLEVTTYEYVQAKSFVDALAGTGDS